MIKILKQLFTWWHKQTLGTFIYTLFYGKFVGKDKFGNKYYLSKSNKRWVIYKSNIEATRIPTQWYSWIHFLSNNLPATNEKKYEWQKEHTENLTGTNKAFKRKGSLLSEKPGYKKRYESWK
mgnify:CR=1 FL=1